MSGIGYFSFRCYDEIYPEDVSCTAGHIIFSLTTLQGAYPYKRTDGFQDSDLDLQTF